AVGLDHPEHVDAAAQRLLVLQLFFVAVLDACEVGFDDLVDLLFRQRPVGLAAARPHADRDLVLAALGELGTLAVPLAAAPARVEVAGAVDVAVPGAPAPRPGAAGGQAPRAAPHRQLRARHAR